MSAAAPPYLEKSPSACASRSRGPNGIPREGLARAPRRLHSTAPFVAADLEASAR